MNPELANSLRSLLPNARATKSAISAALGAFSLVPVVQKEAYWHFLQKAIPDHIEANGGRSSEAARAISNFIVNTSFKDIKHTIRRDRHVWHICLHAYRHDGKWLVVDIALGGILFLTGDRQDYTVTSFGSHGETSTSIEAIQKDQKQDIYAADWGLEPHTIVLFNNGRPTDQSMSITKFAAFAAAIDIAESVHVHQAKLSAYFDPELFQSIKAIGRRSFTNAGDYRDRSKFIKSSTSIIEGIYLPEASDINLNRYLFEELREVLLGRDEAPPPRTAPKERLILFCSLDLEKRRWDEQGEGLLALFEKTQTITSHLTVYVSGMTGPIFQAEADRLNKQYASILEVEKEIAASWTKKLGSFIDVEFLGGRDLLAKVHAISRAHFQVTPAATPSIIGILAGLNGVSYCHPEVYDNFSRIIRQIENITLICRTTAKPSVEPQTGLMLYSWSGAYGLSYSIAPSAFLDEAWPALFNAIKKAEVSSRR
ncbi:hypothetical protein FHS82_002583 [Pseudochelatococcus lubricantis]|uniref:Uncharacterized protein n=1 Tax=Pseudochelatococcus lubricantis TaxID=1538102 RepID=A0ABX0V4M0_9HYPH|nr:hypothetical protein [Pseudochelatococcus lubricantis]NIJ58735.1 hypothetical protein [Pseudochelatococcus lubricantis]